MIGVKDYNEKFIKPLNNAVDDARKIRDLLFMDGPFDVRTALPCYNPTQLELKKELKAFKKRVVENKNCIALLFYSGDWAPLHTDCSPHVSP